MSRQNCLKRLKNRIVFFIIISLFLTLSLGFLLSDITYAQTADKINLQGKIVRNDSGYEGLNVTDGSPACVSSGADTCDFQVKYYDASSAGNLLYTETFTDTEIGDYNGVFNLSLGSVSGSGTYSDLSDLISNEDTIYLQIEFAPGGAGSFTEIFTRTELNASGYAIRSKFAEGSVNDSFKFYNASSSTGLTNTTGSVYYDTTDSLLKVYNGTGWQGINDNLWSDGGTFSFLTSTTDDLVLGGSTPGTSKFFFDVSEGRLGIGTDTPTSTIDIAGASSTISNDTGDITISPAGDLIVDQGNVGIGATNPVYKLDVSGDINLPVANALKFGGTDIVRVNTTSSSIAVGDTTADITKHGITAVGTQAGQGATDNSFAAQGYQAGYEAGCEFAAQGYQAGYSAGSGFAAQGAYAGYNAGSDFAAQGFRTGYNAGSFFAAQGAYAGHSAGSAFVAQGYQAGRNAGSDFAAQGILAGYHAGSDFAAQGYQAGREAGSYFAAQGYYAGRSAGDRFIALGYESTRTDTLTTPAGINDSIAIGYQSAPQYDGHFVLQQANLNSNPLIQGDLNTGKVAIGYPVDVDLSSLSSNGLAVSGNVGIGTTDPGYKLDVAGDINTTGTYLMAGTDYGQYFIDGAGSNDQVWKSDGSGRGVWGSDVGFANPMTSQGDLIYGGASGTPTRLDGSSVDDYVLKYDLATNTPFWATDETGTALSAGTLTGQTVYWNGTSWTHSSNLFNNNTSVGIGTTTPTEKLTLNGGNFLHTASGDPTLKGTYNTTGYAHGVYVSGKYAYVADEGSGLQIIDVSNPASPSLTGTYDTSGNAYGVYVSGKYAYVAGEGSGLQIIDVSNPASPSLTGTYDTSGDAYGVYVSGKYAYVADGVSGLQIIDVSNPASPSLTGTYNASGWAQDVYVSGKYAYVADMDSGLQIIDISNPASPSLTGTYDTTGYARGVYVSGKYAYVADHSSGLQIIDISNPAVPSLTGTYDTSGYANGVYVSGKYAYVADHGSGLQIIDISNPASPSLTGTYDTGGAAEGVYVSGKYAYVADNNSGLQIIDINGIETPSLYAGNIETNAMTITENLDIGNNLYIRNGLNVGPGGLYVDEGEVAFDSNSSSTAFSFRQKGTGDILNVFDNTTEVFTILDGGNVGIGNNAPSHLLDVSGDINFTGELNVNDDPGDVGNVLTSGGDGASPTWSTLSSLSVGNADTLDSLDSTDFLRSNVNDSYTNGILTFDSGTTLDVNGDISIADTSITFDGASTNLDSTGNFSINTDDIFVNKSTGYVGISNTNPTHTLDVSGTARVTGNFELDAALLDKDDQAGTAGQILSSTGSQVDWIDASSIGSDDQTLAEVYAQAGNSIQMNATAGDIRFYNDSSNELLFLDESTGNVGIGTTSPGRDLEVGTTTEASDSIVRVLSADGYTQGFEAHGASQGTGYLYVGQSGSYGGGMIYNGDGTPASGTSTDHISIYRRTGGVDTEVLHWLHSNSTAYFEGNIDLQNNGLVDVNWGASDDGSGSGLDADLLDGQHGSSYLDNTDDQTLAEVLLEDNISGGTDIDMQGTSSVIGLKSALFSNTETTSHTDSNGRLIYNESEGMQIYDSYIGGNRAAAGWATILDTNNVTNFIDASSLDGWKQGGNSWGEIGVLGTNDGYDLRFETNNTTKMTIDTSGDVGIGTTNPGAKLDVEGNSNQVQLEVKGHTTQTSNLLQIKKSDDTVLFSLANSGLLTLQGDFESGTNNTYDVGSTTTRWKDIYTQGTLEIGANSDSGSIRYNTTDDQLEFSNDGSNWIALGDKSNSITLSAEYAGAVMSADGTNNTGFMTSDAEGTTHNSMNYYEWYSSETALQDYDIRVRFTIPDDFVSWGTNAFTFHLATEANSSTNNKVDIFVYEESSATVDGSTTNQYSSTAGVWKTTNIAGSTLNYCDAVGETCVIIMRVYSANDNYVRVGDIDINYNRKL